MIPGILDKFENEIGLLTDCIEGIAIEERNGMCEVEITYPIFSPNWNELKRGNIIVADVNDTLKNQKFRIYKASKPLSGRIKVYARHIFFDLARDIIEEFQLTNASCEYALNELFRRSQFSQEFKGYSDIINAQDYKMSTINLIKAIGGTQGSILDTYGTGAEILRDNRNIHILNRRGHDNEVTIEYAKNMTGLNIEFDDSNLITRIKAIAKYTDDNNNEIIVKSNPEYVDSPLINSYETPFISEIDFSQEFENDEAPTAIKLRELAEKYFRDNKCDQVKTNIKVEFIPLSKCVGYEDIQDKISLCDTVTIKDYRYNLDTQAKVIKTHYNFLNDRYEKMELGDPKVTLGNLVGGGNSGPGITGEETSKVPGINDSSFPDTLPSIPTLSSRLYGFDTIELSWTFEAKTYYTYELYASKVKDFEPNVFDLLFKGNASTFLHSAKPSETWYYKVRATNTHGKATAFSNQIAVETVKIENLENYVANAAIGDALIGELNLGRGWFGQLRGNYIDAKQLTVTDGNGKRTLDIDSFGRVSLLPSNFKILVDGKEESVISQSSFNVALEGINSTIETTNNTIVEVDEKVKEKITLEEARSEINQKANEIKLEVSQNGGGNLLINTQFDTMEGWSNCSYDFGSNHYETSSVVGEWVLDGVRTAQVRVPSNHAVTGGCGIRQRVEIVKGQTYTLSVLVAAHRCRPYIYLRGADNNEFLGNYMLDNPPNGGKNINNWKKLSITFKTETNSAMWVEFYCVDSQNNGHAWFAKPMLNEGTFALPWNERPISYSFVNQSLTANSIINKVTESLSQGGKIQGVATIIDKDKFLVKDSQGGSCTVDNGALYLKNGNDIPMISLENRMLKCYNRQGSSKVEGWVQSLLSNDNTGGIGLFASPGSGQKVDLAVLRTLNPGDPFDLLIRGKVGRLDFYQYSVFQSSMYVHDGIIAKDFVRHTKLASLLKTNTISDNDTEIDNINVVEHEGKYELVPSNFYQKNSINSKIFGMDKIELEDSYTEEKTEFNFNTTDMYQLCCQLVLEVQNQKKEIEKLKTKLNV